MVQYQVKSHLIFMIQDDLFPLLWTENWFTKNLYSTNKEWTQKEIDKQKLKKERTEVVYQRAEALWNTKKGKKGTGQTITK